jgi:UDP-N-acetylglucosamine 2-epimerase (non-hydrolysing)
VRKNIAVVIGTRPEAIKMAPVIHGLMRSQAEFNTKVYATGQHLEMLSQALGVFGITPDVNLKLMSPGQGLGAITSAIVSGMGDVFSKNRPDIVLVHGDTTTALSTAIAAFYQAIPVGHVEAGLRTYNLKSPFPEEFNRQTIGRIAKWHFTPTVTSKSNLLAERVPEEQITVTGNTVIDSMFWTLQRIDNSPSLRSGVEEKLDEALGFEWKTKKFILITSHRRENFGDGLENICEALLQLSKKLPSVHFVYSVHPNPSVSVPVNMTLGAAENIHLIEPLDYQLFSYLLRSSYLVLTDSGGIQEEAPSLGKPVLVMRDSTERPEAISAGTASLVGSSRENIIEGVIELLTNEQEFSRMSLAHNPFGDGLATERIINALKVGK